MNSAVAITTIVAAVLASLGIIFKGGGTVIKHIVDLVTEMKSNTKAIQDVGSKIDNNFTATTSKLTDHEHRITQLEGKGNA